MNINHHGQSIERRRFIRSTATGALAAVGIGRAVAPWWANAASRSLHDQTATDARSLVIVQLSGGNDGLNTIVPYADDAYQRNRLTLAYDKNSVLKIDDYLGWHPSARGLAELLDDGLLSVIQGVGYPHPNRSHFESMDLWQTAHQIGGGSGWLGRFADAREDFSSPKSVYVGRGVRPLAMQSRDSVPLTVRRLDQFQLSGDRRLRDLAGEISRPDAADDDLTATVAANLRAALDADRQLAAAARYANSIDYRGDSLSQDLKQVATMIRAELPARIYYVTLDGFDTHANQRDAHAALLDQLGGALRSFMRDLAEANLLDRVLVMGFSEFGRRVKENGSQGTDHGVAGPMFLAGGAIKKPLVGNYPSLTDLDDGDLKHAIDYRSVYRTVLEQWMGTPTAQLISGDHPLLEDVLG